METITFYSNWGSAMFDKQMVGSFIRNSASEKWIQEFVMAVLFLPITSLVKQSPVGCEVHPKTTEYASERHHPKSVH
jgi:hypothetical protein